jgi:hypothetical protein
VKRILLAIALLTAPAFAGKSDIQKIPACVPGLMVQEPDVYYLNPVLAIAIARQWVRDEKARRMKVPCEAPRRIRSPKDEKCYLPGREP